MQLPGLNESDLSGHILEAGELLARQRLGHVCITEVSREEHSRETGLQIIPIPPADNDRNVHCLVRYQGVSTLLSTRRLDLDATLRDILPDERDFADVEAVLKGHPASDTKRATAIFLDAYHRIHNA